MSNGSILIVDDEATIRLMLRVALETDGYEVKEAASAHEAMTSFRSKSYDLVILDLRLGAENGLNVLATMSQCGIRTPTLMFSAHGNIRNAVRAMQLGAIDFQEKSVAPSVLRQKVSAILHCC